MSLDTCMIFHMKLTDIPAKHSRVIQRFVCVIINKHSYIYIYMTFWLIVKRLCFFFSFGYEVSLKEVFSLLEILTHCNEWYNLQSLYQETNRESSCKTKIWHSKVSQNHKKQTVYYKVFIRLFYYFIKSLRFREVSQLHGKYIKFQYNKIL